MEVNYKGLHAFKRDVSVSEFEIDQQLEMIADQAAIEETVTGRPAEEGDTVILDYAGFVGDWQFDGGTAQRQSLTLGSGMFIPGFEEQLVGANIGDEVDVNVTFPEVYHSDDLAGKEAVFKCKIHEIRTRVPAEINDEFVKAHYPYQSVEELRQVILDGLTEYKQETADNELKNELLGQILMVTEYEPSEEELENEIKINIEGMERQMAQNGMSMELYCEYTGNTLETIRESIKPEVINTLKARAVIMEIARCEDIKATAQDIEAEFNLICERNGLTHEQVMQYYDADMAKRMKENIMMNKAMNRVMELAVIE